MGGDPGGGEHSASQGGHPAHHRLPRAGAREQPALNGRRAVALKYNILNDKYTVKLTDGAWRPCESARQLGAEAWLRAPQADARNR